MKGKRSATTYKQDKLERSLKICKLLARKLDKPGPQFLPDAQHLNISGGALTQVVGSTIVHQYHISGNNNTYHIYGPNGEGLHPALPSQEPRITPLESGLIDGAAAGLIEEVKMEDGNLNEPGTADLSGETGAAGSTTDTSIVSLKQENCEYTVRGNDSTFNAQSMSLSVATSSVDPIKGRLSPSPVPTVSMASVSMSPPPIGGQRHASLSWSELGVVRSPYSVPLVSMASMSLSPPPTGALGSRGTSMCSVSWSELGVVRSPYSIPSVSMASLSMTPPPIRGHGYYRLASVSTPPSWPLKHEAAPTSYSIPSVSMGSVISSPPPTGGKEHYLQASVDPVTSDTNSGHLERVRATVFPNVTAGRIANASLAPRESVLGNGHFSSDSRQKLYKCIWPGCGKDFVRHDDRDWHEQSHFNHQCDGCRKQFANGHALNNHLRTESGTECAKMVEAPQTSNTAALEDTNIARPTVGSDLDEVAPGDVKRSDVRFGMLPTDEVVPPSPLRSDDINSFSQQRPQGAFEEDKMEDGVLNKPGTGDTQDIYARSDSPCGDSTTQEYDCRSEYPIPDPAEDPFTSPAIQSSFALWYHVASKVLELRLPSLMLSQSHPSQNVMPTRSDILNIVEIQYPFGNRQVLPEMIWQAIIAHNESRDAVSLLSKAYYGRRRDPTIEILRDADTIQGVQNIRLSLQHRNPLSADDAMAALHLVSLYLFAGGRRKWDEFLFFATVYVRGVLEVPLYRGNYPQALECASPKDQFIIKTTIWFDVLASITTQERPILIEYIRKLFQPDRSRVGQQYTYSMLDPMGCENDVVWALAETSCLSYWKSRQERTGDLSIRELIPKALEIDQYLATGRKPFPPQRDEHSRRLFLASEIFRTSTKLFLMFLKVGEIGDYRHVPAVRACVDDCFDAITQYPSAETLAARSSVFGVFICGALTDDLFKRHVLRTYLIQSMRREGVGNMSAVLEILEKIWCRTVPSQRSAVPWRQYLNNSEVLLV